MTTVSPPDVLTAAESDIRFEQTLDYAFNSDLITFKATWRADGALIDTTGAIKAFAGASS